MKLENKLGFKRTNRFNEDKQPAAERKDWLSECGHYRIRWHCVFKGVSVLSSYYALRLDYRNLDGKPYWDFALPHERRPYRTLEKAAQACYKAAGIIGQRRERSDKGKSRIPLSERIHRMVGNRVSKSELRVTAAERAANKIVAAEREAAEEAKQQALIAASLPKKRGRPVGSKNKKKRRPAGSKKKRKQRSDKGRPRSKK